MNRNVAVKVAKQAEEVLAKIAELLDIVNGNYVGEERHRLQKAIGLAIGEIDLEVLEPIYSKTKPSPGLRSPSRPPSGGGEFIGKTRHCEARSAVAIQCVPSGAQRR
jgi:hypothetical protein